MKFEYKDFSCDVDIFYKEDDLIVRFYNSSIEPKEEEIIDLVIVDSGFGYLYIKFKGDAALIGGFLDEDVFSSDELVDAAIDFIENLSPKARNIYIPHHVDRVKRTSFVEYNGEY